MKALLEQILAVVEKIERDIHRLIHAVVESPHVNCDDWEEDHPDS